MNRAASQIVRSRAQLEASALRLLRNAMSQPGMTDDAAIAFAVAAMGKENAGIVARVWAKHFTTTEPI
jgi:hypothetical protein